MKKAIELRDMLNSFDPRELVGEELDLYYCADTIEARTGDVADSPILDLMEACQVPGANGAYLLVGHRGCGKSTELNKMAEILGKEGYKVRTISCFNEMNIRNPYCTDIMMLIGITLLRLADEIECNIDEDCLRIIETFWDEKSAEVEKASDISVGGDAGIGANASGGALSFLKRVLNISASISTAIKYNEERVEKCRERVVQRSGDWIDAVNTVADAITEKLDGRQPILIFEDLDKLQGDSADGVFFDNQTPNLGKFSFPTIYTFPIAMRYSPKYGDLGGYFRRKFFFPMIKLETPVNTGGREEYREYEKGYLTIRSIVRKRADLDLFDGDEFFKDKNPVNRQKSVLYMMIKKTGGSLRDLFTTIIDASTLARRRGKAAIGMEDANDAATRLKRELKCVIETRNYPFLASICNGNRQNREDNKMILDMMQGGVVLEYNGDGWFDVHPLIREFLEQQGVLELYKFRYDEAIFTEK